MKAAHGGAPPSTSSDDTARLSGSDCPASPHGLVSARNAPPPPAGHAAKSRPRPARPPSGHRSPGTSPPAGTSPSDVEGRRTLQTRIVNRYITRLHAGAEKSFEHGCVLCPRGRARGSARGAAAAERGRTGRETRRPARGDSRPGCLAVRVISWRVTTPSAVRAPWRGPGRDGNPARRSARPRHGRGPARRAWQPRAAPGDRRDPAAANRRRGPAT